MRFLKQEYSLERSPVNHEYNFSHPSINTGLLLEACRVTEFLGALFCFWGTGSGSGAGFFSARRRDLRGWRSSSLDFWLLCRFIGLHVASPRELKCPAFLLHEHSGIRLHIAQHSDREKLTASCELRPCSPNIILP